MLHGVQMQSQRMAFQRQFTEQTGLLLRHLGMHEEGAPEPVSSEQRRVVAHGLRPGFEG